MQIIFKIADDEGILLIDSKDLRSMLTYVGENAKDYALSYGNIAKQSLTSIIRAVIADPGGPDGTRPRRRRLSCSRRRRT